MSKILSEQDLYDLLKLVCTDCVALTGQSDTENHFFGSYEEAETARNNRSIHWPAIIMGPQTGGVGSNNLDIKKAKIFVLKQGKREEFTLNRLVRDECLVIGMALMERLNQYRHSNNGKGQLLQHFHTSEIKYDEIGSTLDNGIGYMITFPIGSQRNFKTEL